MTLNNGNVIDQMNEIFERMHAQLERRFQQLLRQVNSHSNVNIHSHKTSETTLIFNPINELQLEQSIQKFGRLTTSKTFYGLRRQSESVLTNSPSISSGRHSIASIQQPPMKKTTSVSTMASENNADVHSSYQILGKHGRQRGQFSNPQDVLFSTNPHRTLLVSDTINQNVQLFSLETNAHVGTFTASLNSKQAVLRRPIGLSNTFDNTSTCLVADYDQHLISRWIIDENGSGKLLKKFGQQSLIGPKGLCVSPQSQRIVVADNKANSICLFDSSGSFLYRFGTRGAEPQQLAGPHYVRFAEQDNDRLILVTDFYNNCVKLFDIERHGQLVTSFGSIGTTNGLFQAPTGLAVDYERGYIFVSDWGNNRIQVFDRQGLFLRLLDLSTSDLLYGPQGLDYDPISQTLAIANSGKHCAVLVRID